MTRKNFGINLFIFIYFLTIILSFLVASAIFNYICLLIGIFGYYMLLLRKKVHKEILLYFILMIISGLISVYYNNNMSIFNLFISIFSYGGITLLLLYYKLDYKFSLISFSLLIMFFVIQILRGITPENVFMVSRNAISIILIYFLTLVYITHNDCHKKVSIWLGIISLILSIWAVGRSGIITMAFIVMGMLILKIFSIKNIKNKAIIFFTIMIFAIAFLIIIVNGNYLKSLFPYLSSVGLNNDDRGVIWSGYIQKTFSNFNNIIFGTSLRNVPIMAKVNNNLHNSYLFMHAYYGIFFFLVNLILLFRTFIYFLKEKHYEMCLIMTAFLLRSFTDWVFCNSFGNIFLTYFALYTFTAKSKT